MENLTGGNPPVRPLPCVVPCKLYFDAVETAKHFGIGADRAVNYHSDREGTQLNYEVLSEAVSAVRCSVPLGTNWKKRIDEDFNSRKDGRK